MTDPTVTDEAHALVSSARVEGTPVFDLAGDKLGTIHSLMIDKVSGQVAYAVLALGSFLGVPSVVHPLPWTKLRYDTGRRGYLVEIDRAALADGPTLCLDLADRPSERAFDEALFGYYGASIVW